MYHGTEAERDEIREKIKRGACHVSPRPPRLRPPRAAALDGPSIRRYRASRAGGARLNVLLTAYSLFELETGKKKAERAFLTKLGRCGSPDFHMRRPARGVRDLVAPFFGRLSYVICDEGQKLKNPNSQSYRNLAAIKCEIRAEIRPRSRAEIWRAEIWCAEVWRARAAQVLAPSAAHWHADIEQRARAPRSVGLPQPQALLE